MGSGGGSSKPSFQFNDQQAYQLNQQNAAQLQQYQLQRQQALGQSNGQMSDYFNRTNSLAQDDMLRNMSYYTNALGGYQNSLNQNTADANSLMASQQNYYNNVLQGQQNYQTGFAGLLGNYNQQQAAQNAEYQQQYLQGLGQYNQDNTAQQQQFMQSYLGQMGQNSQALQNQQQQYQQQYSNMADGFAGLRNQSASNQALLDEQANRRSLEEFLRQYQARDQGPQTQWGNQIKSKLSSNKSIFQTA